MDPQDASPLIWVLRRDYWRLADLAETIAATEGGHIAAFLRGELRRAIVCSEAELPAGVVTMGSFALFRRSGEPTPCYGTLAYPEEVGRIDCAVSIASPEGVALLGLRAGSTIPYRQADGTPSWMHLERVIRMPQ